MKLSELLTVLETHRTSGDVHTEIAGLTQNSRQVLRDHLFVAVRGEKTDGHLYIDDAVSAGAVAVVCEEADFPVHGAAKIVVPDSRVALARLADAFYGHPSARLRVVGVTGTNGKTTITYLVRNALARAGIDSGLMGTIEYRVDGRTIPADRTTPDPVLIHSLLAEMVARGCGAAVMEVSSHALDQRRVDAVHFNVGVFTNLTQDHLDYHRDLDEYLDAKARLFEMLGDYPDDPWPKHAVVNVADPRAGRIIEASRAPVITYGLSEAADVRAVDIRLGADGSLFTAVMPRGKVPVRLSLIGRHNISNALAALAVGEALGLDVNAVVSGIADTTHVPGRLEFIENDRGFTVVVDYAHTDDALRNVLASLREITLGRLITVFGCGGDRDPGKRPKMGAAVRELADFSIITSDNPRSEDPGAIIEQILTAYTDADRYLVETDRRAAIETAIAMARAGDTVLIAGKGHETYQQFRNQTIVFDDRAVARAALAR
ncbi:MAG: UDP-N-acetylmuramoyl-L-alanyl-D-glutamate--2,6-diaminopimelate ligase [Verrucomicrobia bacterium]|nr:UDP-N-acetylmuramoyl-L-alanyl-D-glutamate--2,6-diaminopimelate ligase [Verrucomicrobiota bacterium]